jgi:hypothetical protein
MGNPYRGEVDLEIGGVSHVLRLPMGALVDLETAIEAKSLVDLVERFESNRYSSRDLLALLWAGLRGGGWDVSQAELKTMTIDGGLVAATQAAARLLQVTFSLPEEED